MFELSRQFRFEAAHTLQRSIEAEPSRRIHGHSYRAEVVVRGRPDPATGMVMDLGLLSQAMETARDGLDHRFLDEVAGLGPATMENLAVWIWRTVAPGCPALARVTVYRDSSGDVCSYFGPEERAAGETGSP
jgi:6-pyruvoyltetrahydropterin/6-carboxytetrahydropterin synthase